MAELEERDRRARAVLERKLRQAAEMAAAVQTLGADSRARIEENVRLRLLAQRLGATSKELERVRRASEHSSTARSASAGAGRPMDSQHVGSRQVDEGGSGTESSGGLGEGGDAAAGSRRTAERIALATAWMPERAVPPTTASHSAASAVDCFAAACMPSTSREASPHASRRRPQAAPLLPSSLESTSLSPASSPEALQSQMALREKLRKVRQTFCDIRQDLGYPMESER